MKKVLLVEDEMILCLLNKKIVVSLGHEVVGIARNADEAIKAVLEHKPDYIIMDVRLKGSKMDGISAMVEISKTSDALAIYVTGSSDEETIERAKKTNMAAFFTKPVSTEVIEGILGNNQALSR